MSEQLSSRVILRPAGLKDCRRIWEWRNEQVTREASFNTEYIPFEQHEQWFTRKLADPTIRIFIATDSDEREIGYVRFDISKGEAEISVSIDENERGKGFGVTVIKNGSDYLLATEPVQRIVAHIKINNPASVVAFERAGFVFRRHREIGGVQACVMVYEGSVSNLGTIVK